MTSACGDAPTCDDHFGTRYCTSATYLALREATTVHIARADVEEAYATLKPAWETFPLVRLAVASNHRFASPIRADVKSVLPVIDAAWSVGTVKTGDPAIDAMFLGNGANGVAEGSESYYSVYFSEPLNMRLFTPAAATLPGIEVADGDYIPQGSDIELHRNVGDGSVTATFRYGWGDCALGCDGVHQWVVFLPGDGTATVMDEGGDPLPATSIEYAATLPSP